MENLLLFFWVLKAWERGIILLKHAKDMDLMGSALGQIL